MNLAATKPTFPTYPAYKESGVEWLGEIPMGWYNNKLKYLCRIYSGDSLNENQKKKYTSDNLNEKAYISSKDINVSNAFVNYENGLRIPKDNEGLKVAPNEAILLCIEGGSAGKKIAFTNQSVCFVNKLACINGFENIINKKYLFYAMKAGPFKTQFNLSMTGLIGGVSISLIKNLSITSPSLLEQTAIANFLDAKTTKIDQAIAQKEKMIALLKERKQIVIQNAVTKGLDPNVKMKDSCVEWIGEIPEHWEVKRVKYVANVVLGKMICNQNLGSMELKPYLKSKNIQWLKVDISSVDKMWFTKQEMHQYRLKKDDLVLSEGGEVGKTCIWNNELPECYIQNSAHMVTLNSDSNPFFYLYLFNHIGKQGGFDSIINRVSIGHLTKDKLLNIKVVKPKITEQTAIVDHIKFQSSKIDQAIALQHTQIKKLKEYKATLIDSAVTGKLKVN